MENGLNLQSGLEFLKEQDLIRHNDAQAVRIIEPANIDAAAAWLLWASFDLEHVMVSRTFDAALASRISNIGDCFRWLENLPDRRERRATWDTASQSVRSLARPDITIARVVIKSYTEEISNE